MSIYLAVFWVTLLATALAAVRWGGPPERMVAALYIVAAVATVLLRPMLGTHYRSIQPAVTAIDLLLLAGLVLVTIRHDRWWLPCATALQFLAVLAHVGKLLNPGLWRLGYQLMAVWSAWPTVLILATGIWTHHRSMRTPTST